ncbi:MAG: polysaccharide biosynthesis/export family protein [Candidatus Aegiribacteria sp.]|nr:polysaccharide biosynthesis/export family protein [Candidatus Aegiribacteria sp.]
MLITVLMIILGSAPLQPAQQLTQQDFLNTESTVLELADRSTYVLGPGDIVSVVVEGGSSQILMSAGVSPWTQCTVGGDGYLSVSGIGAVSVNGITIDEAQHSLQRKATGYYPSVRVTLSLIEPRMLRVNVGGMVDQPGTYQLTALNRVSDAVLMAGGISTFGSRRGTMYSESGDTLYIDLNIHPGSVSYVSNPFLTNNAGIIIDVCENPVYLLSSASGIETRELQRFDDFESLLARMGGVTGNISLLDCRVIRGEIRIPVWDQEDGFISTELLPGDTIFFVSLRDSIMVGGAVAVPGSVPYNPESTVRDYIVTAGGTVSMAGSGITVQRNGREAVFDGNAEDAHLLPGDVVNVNYNWFNRNAVLISLVTSLVSIGITIYAISN